MKEVKTYVLLLIFSIFAIFSLSGCNDGLISLEIKSDSMLRDSRLEDLPEWKDYSIKDFGSGDIVKYKEITEDNISTLKVGDVIVFKRVVNGNQALITHRIVSTMNTSNGSVFVTQGDKIAQTNPYNDNLDAKDKYIMESVGIYEVVSQELIIGIVISVEYKNK